MDTIRVVVCGDEGVGKSSLITSLVKEKFVPNIQHIIPPISIPRDFSDSRYSVNSTILVDTSASNLSSLQYEIRQANSIWLVYSDHYTYERISLYWILLFRSMGVNLPIVVCQNKIDLDKSEDSSNALHEEFIPLLKDFKEVEACIRCSAKENYNVNHAFYLCQRAITHPLSPLYDYKDGFLKPLAIDALNRIFYLCDRDQDGYLSDEEFSLLQQKCFNKSIDITDLQTIKDTLNTLAKGSANEMGISSRGFLLLNKFYVESGRHETVWGILRTFHYTDSLSIDDKVLYPKIDIPPHSSVELSPIGYKFLVNLFILFDKDNDGGLNDEELACLFYPTPGIPKTWKDTNFPRSVVCNEQGYVTLQGWLAQWSMTTFLDYKTTSAYLGYFGFESHSNSNSISDALYVTKPRKFKKRSGKVYRAPVYDRTVFNCFIIGASGCGKTSLLESFLGRTFSNVHSPTIQQNVAANNVELTGGKQCYLILEELGEVESAILENKEKLDSCDVLCFAYDSSDPDSFQHLIEVQQSYPYLDNIPIVFVALKADLDRQQQRSDFLPEPFTKSFYLLPPLHICSSWTSSLNELMSHIVEAATNPRIATPGLEPDPSEPETVLNSFTIGGAAAGFMIVVTAWYMRGYIPGFRR
ncbi:ERMES complex Ca(2+)-binding regulatory GTPase [Pichia kluyveri]|uniref:Mitochondrial Rho GTPase n=1 Tax=Pichia kluyveri TaxID=36015 RepID=A0AAV5RBN0_PICKL|nr:ERMES complex Ca(2+)-binding regulatory GTPase [Pichia kluyveri]